MTTNTQTRNQKLIEISIAYCKQTLVDWESFGFSTEQAVDYSNSFAPVGDLAELAEYRFRLTGQLETHDGIAWTGIISRNGEDVVNVEQEGRGGSNFYFPTTAGAEGYAKVKEYLAVAKRAYSGLEYEQADHATAILDLADTPA